MAYSTQEFSKKVELFLDSTDQYFFLSSSRVYAASNEPLTEDSPRLLDVCTDETYLATDEYALAKARQENILLTTNKKNWTIIRPYKTYNNKKMQNSLLDDGQVFISDGMFIMVENMPGGHLLLISVDVNGYNKKPNRWGHDLFTFQITDNGKLLPMGAEGTAYDSVNKCSLTSTSTTNGIGCTYKALTDKDYFKNLPK